MSHTPAPRSLVTPNTPRPRRTLRRSRSVSPSVRRSLFPQGDESPPRTPSPPSRRVPNAPARQRPRSQLPNGLPPNGLPLLQQCVTPVTPPPRSGRPRTPGAPKRARRE